MAVTLTGTNFVVGATTVAVAGAGVTVTNVAVSSSASLTANFALDAAAVSYTVVLTKGDEVKAADQNARIAATLEGLRKHVAAYPEVMLTSARAGEGVGDLRAHIARLIVERTAGPTQFRSER